MNKTYPKPEIGSQVTIAQATLYTCTEGDSSLTEGWRYPSLSGRAPGFQIGDTLDVLRIVHFPKNSWKALVRHADGRVLYMSDWEIHEPKRVDADSEEG